MTKIDNRYDSICLNIVLFKFLYFVCYCLVLNQNEYFLYNLYDFFIINFQVLFGYFINLVYFKQVVKYI